MYDWKHNPQLEVSTQNKINVKFKGKGGDLNKWKSRRVSHVTFADVARESVEQSRERYEGTLFQCKIEVDLYLKLTLTLHLFFIMTNI